MQKNDPPSIQPIDFESLRDQAGHDFVRVRPWQSKKSIIWVSFGFLVICAAGVFLLLPKYIVEHQVPEPAPAITTKIQKPVSAAVKIPEPVAKKLPGPSAAVLEALKLQAETLLLKVITKQEALQKQGVHKWAKEAFLQALALGSDGDEHYRKHHYSDAIDAYRQAIDALGHLEEQVVPTLARHLEQGGQALARGEKAAAVFHFELAVAIDGQNTQALNGLKRAATLTELFSLLEKGGNLEAANHLEAARQTYRQALALDLLSPQASAALHRVSKRLTELEFSRLIASGYSFLGVRQFADARNAFDTAQKLSPDSDEPKQGLARLARTLRDEKIAALTIEARHFEANQKWAYAAQSYEQVLALSPDANFAEAGMARAQHYASLLERLDEYVNNNTRLYSAAVADEAQQLLLEVAALDAPGSKIRQREKTLAALLKAALQPIVITLQSDNQTDVVVFKVGKFGRFTTRELRLKPGRYTIVGQRTGYRDFRKVIVVSADMPSKNIPIRCDEPI